MLCHEFRPSARLRPAIQRYVSLEENEVLSKPVSLLVPPPLGESILFFFGRPDYPVYLYSSCFKHQLVSGEVLPQLAESCYLEHRGGFSLMGVRLEPGQIRRFLSVPNTEPGPRPMALEALPQTDLLALHRQLQLLPDIRARVRLLDHFFQVRAPADPEEDMVDRVIGELIHAPHQPVLDLTTDIQVSRRHIRRVFKEQVGVGLKTFQKIVRVNRALQLMHRQTFTKISEVAHEAGYYDHSHFNAEFRSLVGVKPKNYLTKNDPLIRAWLGQADPVASETEEDEIVAG